MAHFRPIPRSDSTELPARTFGNLLTPYAAGRGQPEGGTQYVSAGGGGEGAKEETKLLAA